jgi:methionyl aminopeptidase
VKPCSRWHQKTLSSLTLCLSFPLLIVLALLTIKPNKSTISDIGFVITEHAEKNGYSIVREYVGHGTGKTFHEGPRVEHFSSLRGTGSPLEVGTVITIEPMLNTGSQEVIIARDQWTVKTKDGGMSCQWEHTLIVTEDGFEILTWREGETWPVGIEQPREGMEWKRGSIE